MNNIMQKVCIVCIEMVSVLSCQLASAAGGISFDHTLTGQTPGPATMVPLVGGTYTIPASQGYVSGPTNPTHNLFFSFGMFSVDAGETALFTNDLTATYASTSFSNLIARVTGGNPTTINGTIDSTAFPSAQLWFINPAGVTVGHGATLNVPGGFAGSAADYISFSNQQRWYAVPGTAGSTLSVSAPGSFGFLSNMVVDTTLTSGPANTGAIAPSGAIGSCTANCYSITTNYGVEAGTNEFFSFQSFDVGTGASALFATPSGTTNIISRVTGGALSKIDGTISTPTNVSFWLIDPTGVVVAQNASIDVTGALGLGAADKINFSDGSYFYALPSSGTSTALQSTVSPSPQSFGFLPTTPASGTLTIQPGELGSSAGSVVLTAGGQLSVDGTSIVATPTATDPGDVVLQSGTSISATYTQSFVPFITTSGSLGGGNVTITAPTVVITGGRITTETENLGNAGSVSITATGADPANGVALAFNAATIYADGGLPPSTPNAGNVTFSAPNGTIAIGAATFPAQSFSSGSYIDVSANYQSGEAGLIILQGRNVDLTGVGLAVTQYNGVETSPSLIISATGSVTITNDPGGSITQILGGTEGSNPGRPINITGSSIQVTGGTQIETYGGPGTGSAGNVSVTATGPDQGGIPALEISGGSAIVSSATNGSSSVNSGNISLSAQQGTVVIGTQGNIPTALETFLEVESGPTTGAQGEILVTAKGVLIANSQLLADTSSSVSVSPNTNAIEITASGAPVEIYGTTLSTSTEGSANASNIYILAPSVSITNSSVTSASSGSGNAGLIDIVAVGANPTGASALSITGGSTVSVDALGGTSGANAGAVTLMASNGSIQIGLPADAAQTSISTAAGPNAGAAGAVTISGGTGIALGKASVTTTAGGAGASLASAAPSTIELTANGGAGPLTVANSTLDATTSGAQTGGQIDLIGSNIAISNSNISSQTSSAGRAGDIDISGTTVSITGGTSGNSITVSTSGSGNAGNISIIASAADPQPGTPALQISGGESISSDASMGQGGANAGTVTLTASVGAVQVGLPTDTTQTTLSTSVGSMAGNGGSVTISSAGGLTIANAFISSQSVGGTGYGGQISLTGSGVLVAQQSLISADYHNPGGNPGAAGSIAIGTTGAEAANDPLQADLTTVTPGVVRLVNSDVTASNDGGVGRSGDIGNNGGVSIGASSPGVSSTGSVIIVGSGVSTDVRDGGLGNNLTISANSGVYVAASTNGGFPDPIARPSIPANDSLISAQTDATAVSGGQIAINAGIGGVTVISSNIYAGTTRTQSGITITASGGAVTLSDAVLQSNTLSANRSGDITIGGTTVSADAATRITAQTTGAGNAGNINITASGSDPQGGAALQLTGGTSITSDSLHGQRGANAGNVTITASNGTAQVGLSTDKTQTSISTSAGMNAGAPGTVMIAGAAISLGDASITTLAGGSASSTTRGTIVLDANSGAGPLTITDSTLDATTSGPQTAGEIDLQGLPIMISDSSVSSRTVATGAAGAICVSSGEGSCMPAVSAPTGAAKVALAAFVEGSGAPGSITVNNSTLSTDANQGTAGAAAGNISLTSNGVVLLQKSSLLSTAGPLAGPAGTILVTGSAVTVAGSKGTLIDPITNLLIPESIATATSGAGLAGPITVTATNGPLDLSSAGVLSLSSSSLPNAGTVGVITLTGSSVSITDQSLVSATSAGGVPGAAASAMGNAITIASGASPQLLIADSQITTFANVASGGNILVSAGGSALTLHDALIQASAGAAGNGGNIRIVDAGDTLLEGSGILAETDSGRGGAINIDLLSGAVFVQDSHSLVSAQSNTGNNGTITISSPQVDLNSALRVPDVSAATAPALSANACRRDRSHSTFVREGRGSVPLSPDEYLGQFITSEASSGTQSAPTARRSSGPALAVRVAGVSSHDCL